VLFYTLVFCVLRALEKFCMYESKCCGPGNPTGTGHLNYYGIPRGKLPPAAPPTGPLWNDTYYRMKQGWETRAHPNFNEPPPVKADRVIIFLNTQNRIDGVTRWFSNNVLHDLPHTPYLIALKNKLHHVFEQKPPPEMYGIKNYNINVPTPNPNATRST
jgi:hypothetical protein